ncbi:hypothetical protein N7456_011241 [Penicillium angulare]|uniref:NACHT-NTPase and P-loop NTPases N-terminal domain-containing protein n=1 Tax=Penicillium angulare TaxID=116970 RepID=A0A9W9ETM2_9EURO|nr:hypothetical protein N7456_011241 [Penicillium angulare]
MSDPFSIASGAVGIISLGIQFCKEITKYTEAWRGYDWDIESINLKAKSLETPLKRLREFVEDTRLTDAETANDIVEKTLELDRHLKRLKDRLLSVQPIISESLADQVRNKLRRAAYPLRAQDALRDIETDLDRVQSTIELALTM